PWKRRAQLSQSVARTAVEWSWRWSGRSRARQIRCRQSEGSRQRRHHQEESALESLGEKRQVYITFDAATRPDDKSIWAVSVRVQAARFAYDVAHLLQAELFLRRGKRHWRVERCEAHDRAVEIVERLFVDDGCN